MRVIGTAGHVDHGKSTLVKALTGIDPDRLKEEKEREMTIDLGFAWLTLPSGQQVSIVDVPGHEDFIKNMLAGIGGIDAALLVVAADEGVMPQTREHLAILDLLQVKGGIVALTKIDLASDAEWLEMVTAEVSEILAGTVLEGAPIVPVSAKTGEGLPRLVGELDRLLAQVAPRADISRPRLPIDRVFTIAGFGTVVTGTLIDGHFEIGQDIEVLPVGRGTPPTLQARIRGLQTHKSKVEKAMPGSRVAVNLTGLSTDALGRGDVVTTPGWLTLTQLIDVQLRLLRDAPRPLAHNAAVDFFTGSAQLRSHVRLLEGDELAPGGETLAQLRLTEPVAVVRGDRFIVRQASPSLTLGGGEVIDPHPARRYRRFSPEVIERLKAMSRGSPDDVLLQAVQRGEPCEAQEAIRRSGLPGDEARLALSHLLADDWAAPTSVPRLSMGAGQSAGRLVALDAADSSNPVVATAEGWARLRSQLTEMVTEYHRQFPLRAGMPREELKSRLGLAPRAFNAAISRAVADGALAEAGEFVRLSGHEIRFRPAEQRKVDELIAAFGRSPYTPPSLAEAEVMVGPEVLAALIEQGQLVKVSDQVVFLATTYHKMIDRIITHIKANGSITAAEVRDQFATSRKYAIALLEHLDERKVTKRVGDARVLRQQELRSSMSLHR